jgi:hypothetical protein
VQAIEKHVVVPIRDVLAAEPLVYRDLGFELLVDPSIVMSHFHRLAAGTSVPLPSSFAQSSRSFSGVCVCACV